MDWQNLPDNHPLAEAFSKMLSHYEGDISREGLLNTPERAARGMDEVLGGYNVTDDEIFGTTFSVDHSELVTVTHIPYYSMCEHHVLPFIGEVHIGYVPDGKILGLSKFVRLVRAYSQRLQIQEQLVSQIADSLDSHLSPKGLMVVVTGEHLCMSMRGVRTPGVKTITRAVRGSMETDRDLRHEFLSMIAMGGTTTCLS
jgi:GTP cyclohydrolase I